ncbi:MAG: efflux RND transporter periplasmic adaptor subunit [Nitrospiraceae bacterium]|nr:efflux RND transporter periplasmic adaptor subunit [Nitrospiraceae bacterium]
MKVMKASALILSAAVLLAACQPKPKAAPPGPAAPVLAAYAAAKTIPVQIDAIGSAEAYNSVQVKSMVNGQIVKIYYRDGQFVRKGQLLFEIDRRPYEAALKQAMANLSRDQALAENAKRDAERYAFLVRKDYVPREQYDQLRANAAAQAAVVLADKAAIENIQVQLDYCMIRSPIDGRTGSTQIQIGNVVKANDVPMLVIEQVNPIYVSFSVPERYLADIKKYSAGDRLGVEASVPGQGKGAPETGWLSFINNQVDTNTGTILLKATFKNQNRSLWPGQFVNVALTLTTLPGAVLVPSEAVQTGQQGQYVYIIRPDMTVSLRPVVTDGVHERFTIIKNGVAAGERVVTDGQLRLVPGRKVSIKSPVAR